MNAVVASGARMFALAVPQNLDLWGPVRLAAPRWSDMEAAASHPGPTLMNVYWSRLAPVLIDDTPG